MIEVLFQIRKDKYKDNPILPEGLDLVEEDEQITHKVLLDDELLVQEGLSECTHARLDVRGGGERDRADTAPFPSCLRIDVFKADPNFLDNEDKYKSIKAEILGDDESDESGGSTGSGSESDDESEEEGGEGKRLFPSYSLLPTAADFVCTFVAVVANKHGIKDMTETNMINLRRTIYLTIMNSVSPREWEGA